MTCLNFGLKKNVYICNTCIPPENSDLHKQNQCDYFATLKAEVAKFSVIGDIMIVGDLNSRTGDLNETYSDVEEIMPQDDQQIDNDTNLAEKVEKMLNEWYNEDIIIKIFGRQLVELAGQRHIAIVNGRVVGDLRGESTCFTYNGTSTVDYCITSLTLFESILDHSPFSVCLRTGKTQLDEYLQPEHSLTPAKSVYGMMIARKNSMKQCPRQIQNKNY